MIGICSANGRGGGGKKSLPYIRMDIFHTSQFESLFHVPHVIDLSQVRPLPFDFPIYGHTINNIAVTTSGTWAGAEGVHKHVRKCHWGITQFLHSRVWLLKVLWGY